MTVLLGINHVTDHTAKGQRRNAGEPGADLTVDGQLINWIENPLNVSGMPGMVQEGVADTVWKVGCYKINPSTRAGQKFFILHMLVLPLIPITALVIQNSVTMNTLLGYQTRVQTIRNQVYVFFFFLTYSI